MEQSTVEHTRGSEAEKSVQVPSRQISEIDALKIGTEILDSVSKRHASEAVWVIGIARCGNHVAVAQ